MSLLSVFLFVVSYHVSGVGTTQVEAVNNAVGPYQEMVQAPAGKIFVGWVDHEVTTPTDIAPKVVTYTGALTGVTADKDLYALFGNPTGEYTATPITETFESYAVVQDYSSTTPTIYAANKDVVWRFVKGGIASHSSTKAATLQYSTSGGIYPRLICSSIHPLSNVLFYLWSSNSGSNFKLYASSDMLSWGDAIYSYSAGGLPTSKSATKVSKAISSPTNHLAWEFYWGTSETTKFYLDDITLTINIPTCTGYTTSAGCQSCLQVTLR